MKKFIVRKNSRLKDFTDETYPQGSFAFAALMRARDIKVNGMRVSSDIMLKTGDEVAYYTTPAQESKPSHIVVYSDENVVVCDKYDGVSAEGLLSELSFSGEVYAVHRLDRNTAGIIIYARTLRAKNALERAFKDRRAEKIYLALCRDGFKCGEASLTAYLKKDADSSRVTISDRPTDGYSRIVTEYKVLEKKGNLALVKIVLHTGKTHQIRAHMAYIGCPLLGDEKYGDRLLNEKFSARRQRLVSKSLHFNLEGELSYLNDLTFESSFLPEI